MSRTLKDAYIVAATRTPVGKAGEVVSKLRARMIYWSRP